MPVTRQRRIRRVLAVLAVAAASTASLAPISPASATAERARDNAPVVIEPSSKAKKSLTLSRTDGATVVNGLAVGFTGKAPRRLVGKRVSLERAAGGNGEWIRVDRAKITKAKTFAVSGVASGVGQNKWRVRVKSKGNVDQSPTVSTTVYGWFYLSETDMVDYNRFTDSSVAIGGSTYARSMVNSTSFWYDKVAWGEWNLNYHCLLLSAAIGLDNSSTTGSQVAFRSYLDGAETSHGTLGLGPAVPLLVDISTRLRLRLESRYVAGPLGSGDTSGYGAWGDAQVLCSAPPG